MNEIERKIINIIDELNPYIKNEEISFVKYENNIAYIKMRSHFINCHMQDVHIKEGIESAILNEINEVMQVITIA